MRFANLARAGRLLACLVALLFLFGCFERIDIIPAEREQVSESFTGDADGDGVKDQFVFKFEPVLLAKNTTMTRTITVKGILKPPVYLVNLTDILAINASAIEQARFEAKQFDEARNKLTTQGEGVERLCRERMGIGEAGCGDKTQCYRACQNVGECRLAFYSFGEPIFESMIEFQASARELDAAVEELDEDLKSLEQSVDLETVKRVLVDYAEVRKLAGKHSSNLLFDKNFYGLCEQIPFDFNRLENSRQVFINAVKVGPNETLLPGVRFVGPTEHEVAVQLKLERKSGDAYSEVAVIEEIPKELVVDAGKISFGLNYSEISSKPPFIIKWSFTNVGGGVGERNIAYIVHSAPEPEGGWETFAKESVDRPRFSISTLTISTIPGYDTALSFYAKQAESIGFFPALGLIATEVLIAGLWVYAVARFALKLLAAAGKGKSIKDVVYDWAGRGGQNRLTYIAIGVAALAIAFGITKYYELPEIPVDTDFIEAITKNPIGSAVAGSVFFGIMSIYFVAADFLKGIALGKRYLEKPIPIGVRAVLFEGQVIDLSKMLNDKLDSLLKRAEEAKRMKFSFDAEEADAEEIRGMLKKALKASKDDIVEANTLANTAKTKYQKLVEKTGEKINYFNELAGAVKDAHSASEHVNALLREGKASGADVEDEEVGLKRAEVEEALAKAEEKWSINDFDGARGTLRAAIANLARLEKDLKEKVGERKGLLERRLACAECGKSISILSKECQYCGVNVSLSLSRKINKMRDDVEELKKKIGEAKELVNFEYEEKTLAELKATLGKALHAIETGSYDEAANIVEAESARMEKLKPTVEAKVESYEGISKRITNLEDHIKDILELFGQAKKFEVNIEKEEKEYKEVDVDSMLGKAEALFKQDRFDEANEILGRVEDAYEDLERKLNDLVEAYRNVADRISLLSKEILISGDYVSKCKALGVSVDAEESELRSINVQQLRAKAKERKPVSLDLDDASSKVSGLKKKLAAKLEYGRLFSERITELSKKFDEVEELVAKCISLSIDTWEEQRQLATVDVREIKNIFEKGGDVKSIQRGINGAIEVIEDVKISLKQKLATGEQWSQWSPHITQLLERKDKITEEMLSEIPEKWRRWALEKYVSEHAGEALVIENGALAKLSLPQVSKFQFELVLQSLVLSEKVEAAAIVRRDGLPIASNLPTGVDPETIAALATKILSKAESASSEMKKGSVARVIVGSENGKLIVTSAGRSAVLIALVKPKEELGFALMALNQATEKIIELLGR